MTDGSTGGSPRGDRGAREGGALLRTGRNCWRIENADRVGLIVDAADYFVRLRFALSNARRQVLLIGWDFDFEIDMLPGESDAEGLAPDGLPNRLGDYLEAVVERAPNLHLYLLKWNGALLLAPGRFLPSAAMRVWSNPRVHFALDGHHPLGACHHHKIVVVDDALAFCGGIDATEDRWDTPEHMPEDPRRRRKDGSQSPPWHDATTALDGRVAATLGTLSRTRWERATGEALDEPSGGDLGPLWPDDLPVAVRDVEVGIARTEPPYDGEPIVDEIERLYLDGIAAARRSLYLESQYFCCQSVCDAIERRLREPDGPEVVVINPQAARSELEDQALHVLRARQIETLRRVDAEGRFRIWYPVNAAGDPIYVHAKVMIVDDRLLKIGSSNIDDRSMGFDTECDVAFEGDDAAAREAIVALRHRLIAEHLGARPDAVAGAIDEAGSLVAAIEALNDDRGRGLRPVEPEPEKLLGRLLADSRLLDLRYRRGDSSHAGRGMRPRHLVLAAAAVVGIAVAWRAFARSRPR